MAKLGKSYEDLTAAISAQDTRKLTVIACGLEDALMELVRAVKAVWQEHDERLVEMASPALEPILRACLAAAEARLA